MYGFLWRHLPGHWSVRIGELAVLAVGVVALLFYVVFPAADPHLPFNGVTVQDGGSPSGTTPVTPPSSLSTAPSVPASTPVAPGSSPAPVPGG